MRATFGALVIFLVFPTACSRKSAQTGPPPPEVLVTTVAPRDVPRILERVATLDGFINANINAQVQSYIVSRDYTEGSIVKKGDLLFQIDPRPFEAALAQAKGTLGKDKANQVKADADEKRALDLFSKKVISYEERDTAIASAGSNRANVEADEAAVKQAELNLGYTKIIAPIEGVAGFANNQVGDLVGPSTGPLTTVSQIDPIKAVVTAGEGPFTDFVSRHPDPKERNAYVKSLDFELILGNGEVYPHKGKFYALDRSPDVSQAPINCLPSRKCSARVCWRSVEFWWSHWSTPTITATYPTRVATRTRYSILRSSERVSASMTAAPDGHYDHQTDASLQVPRK
jgi:RND family efflux transporter MFP subunit